MNLVGNLESLVMDDFTGGMTDLYVEAPLNRYQLADNLLITPNKKLVTRPGSKLWDAAHPQTPDGNERIGALINYDNDSVLLQSVGKDLFYVDVNWVNLKGPTGNRPFNAGDLNSLVAHTQWNRHLFLANDSFASIQKVYRDGAGDLQVRSAGLPKLASNPTITPVAGAGSYIYLFVYSYTYLVDTTTFKTLGPTRQVRVGSAAAPNISTIAITNIPVLSNGLTENWDTANVKVEIFRTANNGTSFYKVGEVTNGTTTFSDTLADTSLLNNEPVYTSGGVLDNDPPPPAKFIHIANGTCYYANIIENGENIPNRVRQAKTNIPDAVPGANFIDVEENIVGISSVKGFPIVLCKRAIYRLDGTFDELGRGSIVYTKINDKVGCISNKSIVQTVDGIFWAANDGFYFSDGYKVQKLSDGLNATYRTITSTEQQKKNIVGTYEQLERRIWWAVQLDGSSLDNDACFLLDLNWPLTDNSTFTTISGGQSFNPTAITFFNGNFLRGDKHGYVFEHKLEYLTDPRVDPTKPTAEWGVQTIIWDFRSASTNFGNAKDRKWVPRVITALKNDSNLSLQIISNNDDGRQILKLSPIRFRGNLLWGDSSPIWGDATLLWNKTGLIDQVRRFPASSLRCAYKQIQLTNAFVNIITSDQMGTVTVTRPPISPVTINKRTVTLDDTVNFAWDVSDIDYRISFEADGYVEDYVVDSFTATALTIIDPEGTAPLTANQKWVLRGYPKGEVMDLLSITLLYSGTSPSQKNNTTTAALDGMPA